MNGGKILRQDFEARPSAMEKTERQKKFQLENEVISFEPFFTTKR
jgi:hypothetical protein